MMEGIFDRSIFATDCRHCGFRNERTVAWVKTHTETECDRCGAMFGIVKPDIEKSPTELDRTMSGLRAMLRTRAADEPTEDVKKKGFFRR
jgi:ribosomal protein L37E